MEKYILSKKAEKDISEIIKYISTDNKKNANKVLLAIRNSCSLIGRMPRIGRVDESIYSKELYYLTVDKFTNYLIFYILIKNKPLIVRVLHAKRNIPTIIKGWYE